MVRLFLVLVVVRCCAVVVAFQVIYVAVSINQVFLIVVICELNPRKASSSQIFRIIYIDCVLALFKVTPLHHLLGVVEVFPIVLLLEQLLLLKHIVKLDLLASLGKIIVTLCHH